MAEIFLEFFVNFSGEDPSFDWEPLPGCGWDVENCLLYGS
jgi:hypothetical protein